MKKISLITFGCKMNQAETQKISEVFEDLGFSTCFDEKDGKSDFYFINTCTVTSEAERKIRQLIRRIKRKNNSSKIIAGGCYVHTDAESILKSGADLILGNHEKKEIQKYYNKTGIFLDKSYWLKEDKVIVPERSYGNRTRIFLPIEEGCLNACSYCRIIFARGTKIRSLTIHDVLNNIKKYINTGYKEIVLTGINMEYFGYGLNENLEKLLFQIEKNFSKEDVRIRLTSLYPDSINENISKLLNESNIFEKHVHFSMQHISSNILKNMGRRYSERTIYKSVEMLRKYNELFSITADLIVGFPGETNKDFEILLKGVNDLKLLKTHSFRFSPRPFTKAERMKKQIPSEIKKQRIKILNKESLKTSKKYLENFQNKKVKVLFESKENNFYCGYDEYYIYHYSKDVLQKGFNNTIIKSVIPEGVVSNVL
ncbi:threonylcarbamoyladenosine tRNA methylthiotransferase MtaB [Tepiditoga spiralis]|uniref:Threonylcarbamoyladenosine tRNA methylthiotransferase MtaB n=1 Tax=Tepiditoga spiralis TaxID=2108365 RepID=A0A7G1G6W4_9BACT|nr:tRNA (N(6)-L-threonylcarbamoyladenosine(37)-C(2))-methylthiotransferase MtaB [Tepiditoga spiralis]BBE31935.1 threonylcarbamoyladenosine tRNA methylthiotransferase MtaB [Tepiditoga spiralis]